MGKVIDLQEENESNFWECYLLLASTSLPAQAPRESSDGLCPEILSPLAAHAGTCRHTQKNTNFSLIQNVEILFNR
jgi:hypothetical protein